jgi:hypothetical protein
MEFESVSNSLGGARPSLNRMAASNINLDAAIQARLSGSEVYERTGTLLQPAQRNPRKPRKAPAPERQRQHQRP